MAGVPSFSERLPQRSDLPMIQMRFAVFAPCTQPPRNVSCADLAQPPGKEAMQPGPGLIQHIL